jgi:hypothetical protein
MPTTVTGDRYTRVAIALVLMLAGGVLFIQLAVAQPASAKAVTYVHRSFQLSGANQKRRLSVSCPGRLNPLGGGVSSSPSPASDGEGVYPHSFERLGVQNGFHSTVVLFDPSGRGTSPHNVTLTVACRHGHRKVTPPHKTVYVNPGQTKTAIATCPGRRHLFGGGFQRTDFTARGGDYITESRAISSKSWSVTGHAFGSFGGELTAIAYCWRSKQPLLTEVSASTTIPTGAFGAVTTPSCTRGHLVYGGFNTSPAGSLLLADGTFSSSGGWMSSARNQFGPTATFTAYGYCLKL